MKIHFLDTSAWIKRYLQEPGSAWVRGLFQTERLMAVSSLAVIEMLSTFARKREGGALTHAQFDRFSTRVLDDCRAAIVVSFGKPVFERALELPAKAPLRGADTVQLASLLHLREAGGDVVLVSGDGNLNAAAERFAVPVMEPPRS